MEDVTQGRALGLNARVSSTDRFELDPAAYQRGFQAGADAARRECAQMITDFKTGAVGKALAAAILSKVGQPVEQKEG